MFQCSTDFGLGDDVEAKFLVHNTGSCLGEIALVGDQAAATKATGTADFVHPLGPLGVELSVGFLVLGLEHRYYLL